MRTSINQISRVEKKPFDPRLPSFGVAHSPKPTPFAPLLFGYMHFADSNRLAPGQGHTDFVQVMHALTSIHYQGVVAVEILPVPDDTTAIHQAGLYLRTLYSQP